MLNLELVEVVRLFKENYPFPSLIDDKIGDIEIIVEELPKDIFARSVGTIVYLDKNVTNEEEKKLLILHEIFHIIFNDNWEFNKVTIDKQRPNNKLNHHLLDQVLDVFIDSQIKQFKYKFDDGVWLNLKKPLRIEDYSIAKSELKKRLFQYLEAKECMTKLINLKDIIIHFIEANSEFFFTACAN